MIDLEKIDKTFKDYVNKFDLNNVTIKRKYYHTLRVKDNCKYIANAINFSLENTNLLILIGYLHDIGRFKQIEIYNSTKDGIVNHADLGVEILFKDNLIRKFIEDNKYDDVIYKAIKYHNKLNLNYELTPKEELFCKSIKDADKLDLLYIAAYYDNIKDFYRLPYVEGAKLNPKVKEDFDSHRLVDLRNRKTAIDKLANILAFIYDLNLDESKLLISEKLINDIIDTFIKTYNVKDTSECLYLKDNILKYLNNT